MDCKLLVLIETVKIVITNANEYLDKKWTYKINHEHLKSVNLFYNDVLVVSFFIDSKNELVYTLYDIYYHNQYDHNTISNIINMSNVKEFDITNTNHSK